MGIVNLLGKISIAGVPQAVQGLLAVKEGADSVFGAIGRVLGPIGELGALLTTLGTGLALFIGFKASGVSTEFDSLTRSLAGVSNGADDLLSKLDRMKKLAALPGLGFAEAILGDVRLESAGLSNRLSERLLAASGNASALSGSNKADTAEALRQFAQIASAGKLTAENLNVIGDRILSIKPIINEVFGGATNEQINALGLTAEQLIDRIVTGMETRLPKAVGGFQNALDNLEDTIQRTLKPLGDGINIAFGSIGPQLERILGLLEGAGRTIGEVIAALGNSGVLAGTVDKLVNAVTGLVGGNWQEAITNFLTGAVTVIGNIPAIASVVSGYLSDVFFNIREAFDYAQKRVGSILEGIGGAIKAIAEFLAPVLGAKLAELKLAANLISNGLDKAPDPKFRDINPASLVDRLKEAGLAGFGQNLQSVKSVLGPLPALPEGLAYRNGEGSAMDKLAKSEESPIDRLLNAIEKNTRKAADALDLRRQSLGGGELARIGVTAAEMGNPTMPYAPPLTPGNSQLEQAVRKITRQEIAGGNLPPWRTGG